MITVKSAEKMKRTSQNLKKTGTIGFVPTMGFLHQGHMSLVRRSKRENKTTVVSIFVNPLQFSPNEDFARYPRNFKRDAKLLKKEGVDYAFFPSIKEIYPNRKKTRMKLGRISKTLCGSKRPGHFKGVATAVKRFFDLIMPTRAYFGQKDFQQTLVVKQLVRDFRLKTKIVVCPTVREKDGLAVSSRNSYLSKKERKAATILSKALKLAKKLVANKERNAKQLRAKILKLIKTEPLAKVDYAEVRNAKTLARIKRIEKNKAIIALAVFIGKTRLIDNEKI